MIESLPTGILGIIIISILFMWALLWLILPFIVWNINSKLARLIEAQYLTIQAMDQIIED